MKIFDAGLANNDVMSSFEPLAPDGSLEVGLVGFGAVCENAYLPWLEGNSDVKLKAIVEISPLVRDEIREKYPWLEVMASIDDLPNSVQLLIITTPPASHAELICQGLSNGMNVFCEKPFVLSLDELEQVWRAKARFGGVVGCCHNWYYSPPIARGLELVRSGALGTPELAVLDFLRPQPARGTKLGSPNWRQIRSSGGGIIRDLGYHGFYLLSSLFSRPPSSVSSSGVRFGPDADGADTETHLRLDFGHRCFGDIHLSWNHSERRTIFDVKCTDGRIICAPNSLIVHDSTGITQQSFDVFEDDSWHANWTAYCLDEFIHRTRTQDDTKICTEIMSTIATLEAACVSSMSSSEELIPTKVNM